MAFAPETLTLIPALEPFVGVVVDVELNDKIFPVVRALAIMLSALPVVVLAVIAWAVPVPV